MITIDDGYISVNDAGDMPEPTEGKRIGVWYKVFGEVKSLYALESGPVRDLDKTISRVLRHQTPHRRVRDVCLKVDGHTIVTPDELSRAIRIRRRIQVADRTGWSGPGAPVSPRTEAIRSAILMQAVGWAMGDDKQWFEVWRIVDELLELANVFGETASDIREMVAKAHRKEER